MIGQSICPLLQIVRGNGIRKPFTTEAASGIILDYADDGRLLAIEILDASTRMAIPKTVEFEVTTAGIR